MANQDKIQLLGVMAQGYGIVPKLVMRDKELSAEAKAVYAYMCSYGGGGNAVFPSMELMSNDLGMSERRLRKHRNLLVERGYLKVQQVRQGTGFKNNIYTLPMEIELKNVGVQNVSVQNVSVQNVPVQNDRTINNNLINNNIINNKDIKTSYVDDESSTKQQPKKSTKRVYQESDECYVLSKYLFELMKRNNEYVKQPNLQTWANELRLMHERDNVPYMVIKQTIEFSQHDSFWKSNILSTKKLREKFATLYARQQQTKGAKNYAQQQPTNQRTEKHYDAADVIKYFE